MQEAHGTHSMPETAEIVAQRHGISRSDQDAFALRSQERTAKAISSGRLAREIAPVPVPQRRGDPVTVATDEHPRETLLDALARLRPLAPGGTVTARQLVRDQRRRGRAAGRLGTGRAAVRVGTAGPGHRRRRGRRRAAGHGHRPGTGNRQAARPDRAGRRRPRLDRAERSVRLAVAGLLRGLGLPAHAEHVNPNGGAIALGHPLGASGARSC